MVAQKNSLHNKKLDFRERSCNVIRDIKDIFNQKIFNVVPYFLIRTCTLRLSILNQIKNFCQYLTGEERNK